MCFKKIFTKLTLLNNITIFINLDFFVKKTCIYLLVNKYLYKLVLFNLQKTNIIMLKYIIYFYTTMINPILFKDFYFKMLYF